VLIVQRSQVEGLVLAGGAGTRMGGVDKGLVAYQGQPLVSHAVACLRPLTRRVIISANRNLEAYRHHAEQVVSDSLEGFQGPMAGLLAGLEALAAPYLVVLPCDMPNVAPVVYDVLLETMIEQVVNVAIAHDGIRRQPLLMAVRDGLGHSIRGFLASGGRAVEAWLERESHAEVDVSPWRSTLENYNTLHALRASGASDF
jgi:molybdenum cofactor guanylyltransferase